MDKMWISRYRWSVSDDGTLSGSVFLVDCDSEIFFYLVLSIYISLSKLELTLDL